MTSGFIGELRRRGVLGALIAYGVAAAGGLQLSDIVVHAMDLPPWSMRLMIWIAALGLPVTFVVSWFWDLTRHGFVRTEFPQDRAPTPGSPRPVTPSSTQPIGGSAPIAPGVVLAGRYRIEKLLGSGGMGKVFSALDTRLQRRVAIKVVLGAHEPSRIRRFEQEARTAGGLEHPNVLGVYDLGEEAGIPFLVTELLDGHTLRTVLKGGPLPPDQAQSVALQLARGLAAAHARGVIHRDLKPENLFVTNDGRLKILDFGLAKLVGADQDTQPGSGLTVTGAIFGTPGYISPEQARGDPATAASDVFAAGAVFYEMLSGERAFPGGSLIEAGHAALTREPPALPPMVPASLNDVVHRAIEKDPQKRFRDGGELVRALEAPGSIAPSPVATTVQALPVRHRRSRTLTLAAVGALGLAVISARVVSRRSAGRQDRRPGSSSLQTFPRPAAQPQVAIEDEDPEDAPDPNGDDNEDQGNPASPKPPKPPSPPTPPGLPVLPDIKGLTRDQLKQLKELKKLSRQSNPQAGEIGIVSGARQLYRAGMAERADEMLRSWLSHRPDGIYAHLHHYWLLRKMGKDADAKREIDEFVTRADRERDEDDDWPMALVRVYAGRLRPDEALQQAGAIRGDPRARLCEAYFYLGLLHTLEKPPKVEEARNEFQLAIQQHTNDIEKGFAREELEALQRAAGR